MGDDEFLHTDLPRFFRQAQALLRRTVSRSEDDIRFGADLHDPDDFRQDFALRVKHRDSRPREFVALMLISCGEGRHPDAAAEPAGGLDRLFRRIRIDSVSVNAVHAEASEYFKIRERLPDQVSAVVTAPVVRLVHDRPVAGLLRLFRQREFIDAARPGVRRTVYVNVADSGQQRIDPAVFPGRRRLGRCRAGRSGQQHCAARDAERLDKIASVHEFFPYTFFPSRYACSGYFV